MEFYRGELKDFTFEAGRPNAGVLELMRSCDVFCLPSLAEGRALVMQEAMSQGLPLLITPNTGGEDLIEEGVTGFLVPIRRPDQIAEKISWFADNRAALPQMSRAAQNKASQLTWEWPQKSLPTRSVTRIKRENKSHDGAICPALPNRKASGHSALLLPTSLTMRAIRKLIWAYIILWLIEGALRRWFLPGLASPLLLIRDPIVIAIYSSPWPGAFFLSSGSITWGLLLGLLTFTNAMVLGHGNALSPFMGRVAISCMSR